MEFITEGKDPRIDTLYRQLETLFSDVPTSVDIVGATQEYELDPDELRIAQNVLAKHTVSSEMQNAQSISFFRQVEEPLANGELADEGFIVSLDDGQLVTLYGLSKSEGQYTIDKALQVSQEQPVQDDETLLEESFTELSFIPTPEAWAAALTEEQQVDGSFNDPDLDLKIELKDLAFALVEENKFGADLDTTDQELEAFIELLDALSQYNRHKQAS